ncbi:helix-turn-helix domain-containing protein [Leptothermofonsia sichuanensis E412]|nr:helix-turn-helix domain-containing protein [Leptothermofonsia sichuanensis]QZZ21385.1 helix-turn-helix domain-containing protein [Leptothermofonsia sichuanensis E412]
MIQLSFSAEEIEQLHYERFHHPHPRVQQKMEALYLKSQGYSHQEITRLLRVTKPTLLSYTLPGYRFYPLDKVEMR